jgi:hypothetical protein
MVMALGTSVAAKGCLTRLIDMVNRHPSELEDLVGFHRGRLTQGFHVLLLRQHLLPDDFEFFGYTYMSGGRIGLPSNIPAVENARPKVQDALLKEIGSKDLKERKASFASSIRLQGRDRFVKIIPYIEHSKSMNAADQYPASKLGITQLNLLVPKFFLAAADVKGSNWSLSNGTSYDVGGGPRHDLPYGEDPRKKVMTFLEHT